MTDTSAHEAVAAQNHLLELGFTEADLAEVCMLPDCGCDGARHPM
jgi:hypothetical protein